MTSARFALEQIEKKIFEEKDSEYMKKLVRK
jgi:hypothetical protein